MGLASFCLDLMYWYIMKKNCLPIKKKSNFREKGWVWMFGTDKSSVWKRGGKISNKKIKRWVRESSIFVNKIQKILYICKMLEKVVYLQIRTKK